MLHVDFSPMIDRVWEKCPDNTNAVKRKNRDLSSHSLLQEFDLISLDYSPYLFKSSVKLPKFRHFGQILST